MTKRRSHSKVTTFSQELVDAVNRKIVDGFTYRDIAGWLNEKGEDISYRSVARYGKDFLSKMESIKMVKEQAKVIVSETGDAPATEMAEAANQLAMQMIMEILIESDKGRLQKEKLTDVLKALSMLEKSSVARESLKLQFQKKIDAAFKKFRDEVWQELGTNPDLYNQVIEYVNRAELKMTENID